ncbi:MAG: stage III sporulation protein AF [Sporomusaceae bacterium]|nr:stage III sporulation protein AF [Sporomusaceae bacterium]
MITAASAWLKTIVCILLFSAFLELLLPSSQMRRFTQVVVGLFIMLALLQPVLTFFDPKMLPTLEQKLSESYESSRSGAKSGNNNSQTLNDDKIAKQIRAALLLLDGVGDVQVTVTLATDKDGASLTKLGGVHVRVISSYKQGIEPVVIPAVNPARKEISPELKEKMVAMISQLYQVAPEKILVE